MKTHYLLVVISCFLHFSSQSQENKKLDSLIRSYNNPLNDSAKIFTGNLICQDLLYSDPDEAFKYVQEMISISKKINFRRGLAKAYHRLGGYYLNRQELDSAEFYHKKSLQINTEENIVMDILNDNDQLGVIYIRKNNYEAAYEALNQNIALYNNRHELPKTEEDHFRFIGSTFHTLSTAYRNQGLFQLALRNELEALKQYQKTGEELFVADAYNSLGAIEGELGNHHLANDYYRKALDTYHRYNDVFFECEALYNLGISLQQSHKLRESLDTFLQALDIAQKHSYRLMEARIYNKLGAGYGNLGELDNALSHLYKSIEISNSTGHPTEIENTYGNVAIVLNKKNQPAKAIQYLNRAISIADSIASKKNAAILYKIRSEAYQKLGNNKEAIQDYIAHTNLNDSIFNETKSRQIEEMRAIFDIETKEQQLALQKKEITVLEQKAEISTLQKILLGGLLLLSLFGFYGIRQKLKRNRVEKEKVDAELAFKKKELTTHALHLAKKNEVLESIKQKAKDLKLSENASGYSQLIKTIDFDQRDDKNWENFTQYFEQVHKDFASSVRAKYPEVTKNELRFMALLKMNLSSKEIANILNITADGIKKARQRLRKKMALNPQESLEKIVLDI